MASTHILEVTIVLIFMVSRVTLVSFVTNGQTEPWQAVEDVLQQRTWDMLHIADDHLEDGSRCNGSTMLEKLVIDGARGDDENWTDWKGRFLAPGFEASMFLDNGDALMALHEPSEFVGVTSDIPYMPNMSYVVPISVVSTVSGLEALPIEVAGLREGHLLRMRGDAVETRVSFTNIIGQGIERESASAVAVATSGPRGPGILVASTDNGEAQLAGHLSAVESTGEAPFWLNFTIEGAIDAAGAAAELPIGTEVAIQMPSDWMINDIISSEWTSPDLEASPTIFRLQTSVPSSTLIFTATAPNNNRPFEVIHARLQNGSLGESTLVLTRPSSPLLDRGLPIHVYPTTPYPVRPGSWATFGAVLANGGDEINVTQVDISVPGGYDLDTHDGRGTDLFSVSTDPADAPVPLAGGELGTWSVVDSKTLRWTWDDDGDPGAIVPTLRAAQWVVSVKINGDASAATSVEPATRNGPSSTLAFSNEFESISSRWGASPGILRHVVAPATALAPDSGYPINVQVHEVNASVQDHRRPVTGETAYRILPTASDVTSTQNALANSSLRVASRLVPTGTIAEVRADIDSLATQLGALEVTAADVTMELYSPMTLGCPTRTWETTLDALPAPSMTDVLVWDGGTGTPSVFAASSDGHVYRIGTGGTTISSFDFAGASAKLAGGSVGLTSRLFVATNTGIVRSVDPTTMGEDWSYSLDALALRAPIDLILLNETRGEILVGTSHGDLVAIDADAGSVEAVFRTQGASVRQIVQDENGETYALIGSTMHRLDENYAQLASASLTDVIGFGVGPTEVFVAREHTYSRLNKATLASFQTIAIEDGAIVLAAHGDVNADGKNDLIMVDTMSAIRYVSGENAWLRWFYSFYQPVGFTTKTYNFAGDIDLTELECHPTSTTGGYTSTVTCGLTVDEGGPRLLTWRPGEVAVHLVADGVPYVWVVAPNTAESIWAADGVLGTLALGNWGATAAFAGASAAGVVQVRDTWTQSELATSSPSQRVGEFSYYMHMPLGGFFGAHVVVLTIDWDQGGKQQYARLIDWFEVTDRSGKPVADPSYRVAIVTQDGSSPTTLLT